MKRVAGSFAGELLLQRNDYRDFRNKALEDNVFNNIEVAILLQINIATGPEKEYRRL